MQGTMTKKEQELINQVVYSLRQSKPTLGKDSMERYMQWSKDVLDLGETFFRHNRHNGFDRDVFRQRCTWRAEEHRVWDAWENQKKVDKEELEEETKGS
jgi:hypothetical protein